MLTSFLGWVLRTVTSVAEAEMDNDASLREQLLEAEMRHETGEISDDEFAEIEADLLQRIREIRERRGESGPESPIQGRSVNSPLTELNRCAVVSPARGAAH